MTGDVLPCFDASTIILPDNSCCIITVPITLDIASNHGVVVASKNGIMSENYSLCLVENLLQKPTMKQLLESQAIQPDGRALLDTGIIAVRGRAWMELVMLSYSSSQMMVSELLKCRKEASFDSLIFFQHHNTKSNLTLWTLLSFYHVVSGHPVIVINQFMSFNYCHLILPLLVRH